MLTSASCPFTWRTGIVADLIFWEKKQWDFVLGLVFRLSLVCTKFAFSAGFQLLGLKTTSLGEPDLKNSFLRSNLRCRDVQGEVQGEVLVQRHVKWYSPAYVEYLRKIGKFWWTLWPCTLTSPWTSSGMSPLLKSGWDLALTLTQNKISNFLQKIKSATMSVHHVKGQPIASAYVGEKGVTKFYWTYRRPVYLTACW